MHRILKDFSGISHSSPPPILPFGITCATKVPTQCQLPTHGDVTPVGLPSKIRSTAHLTSYIHYSRPSLAVLL